MANATQLDNQLDQKPGTLEIPGLTKSLGSFDKDAPLKDDVSAKLIIIMVGVPARGKSYIVKKLARYMNWLQYKTRIFNVGERRRKAMMTNNPQWQQNGQESEAKRISCPLPTSSNAEFFDAQNYQAVQIRDQLALHTLDELIIWLTHEGGAIGILDATNSTPQRRQLLISHIRHRTVRQMGILYLESCCFDRELLDKNFRLKLSGPDYKDQNPEKALADFRGRVANYEKSYVPLGKLEEDQGIPYIQMIDVGRKINTHRIRGYMSTHVVEYLLNFNLAERMIWISCNGESVDDADGRIGRESHLTGAGRRYATSLATFIQKQQELWKEEEAEVKKNTHILDTVPLQAEESINKLDNKTYLEFCVWTSMMPQTIQTALAFPEDLFTKKRMKMLDDLNAGNMTGLTYEEIQMLYPDEFAARKRSKLLYRWPGAGGESYVDVINRLRSVIVDLEGMTDHLLLITHRAVVRVLLGYFLGLQRDDLADMVVPKDSVFCLEPVYSLIPLRSFWLFSTNMRFIETIWNFCSRISI
jgi:6-phosphofructo-2-kinase